MCNYQTLYHNDNTGYVVRCNACDKIQLGFGNLMLTFGQEDFNAFNSWVRSTREEQYLTQKQSLRNIVIPTPGEGVKFLLSKSELVELDEMLEEADTELKSLAILRLFDSNK